MAGWLRKAENKAKAQHSWGWNFAELGKNPHMEENEMFMQCLMMGISVVKGKGVWNNRKNEKIWKNCFEEIGEYNKV